MNKVIDGINNFLDKFFDIAQNLHFVIRLLIVCAMGLLLSYTQAPYNQWVLIFPSFSIFYFLFATSKSTGQAFLLGLVFGLGYFIAGLHWIGNALLVEGNDYKWAWPLAVTGLPLILSLFTALYVSIAHILTRGNKKTLGFLVFCALLGLSEWVRGHIFTGFPWNLYGYTWIDLLPVAQTASVIGPYGLTLLTILVGGAFGALMMSGQLCSKLLILSLCLFVNLGGKVLYDTNSGVNIEYHDDLHVRIVQPNIAQEVKWQPEKLVENFNKLVDLSERTEEGRRIVVWPETAVPPALLYNAAVDERIYSVIGSRDLLLSGALDLDIDGDGQPVQYRNALMAWDGAMRSRVERVYSKSHLVPFGEYIPFQQYIPIPTVTSFSGFERGRGVDTVKQGDFPSFSPLICYEVIFPHQTVAEERPDYILTVTNDGWYGDSAGPYQHFVQARFRAIEQGLSVVRAANTGVSGVIDPQGKIVERSQLLEQASILSFLPKKLDPTFYSKFGDLPFLGSIFLFMLMGFRKQTSAQP